MFKNPKYALVCLTTINLLNYVDRWLVAAVMPSMKADLGMSNTQAGLVMSAFMLGYFLTSPLFGYLADRTKRLSLVMMGTIVWSVATFVSGFGRSSSQIFLSRIAVGIGEASTVSTGQSLIGDFFPPQRRNQAMAYFTAAIPVGSALGFVLGGVLEHHWGWRTAFFIAGIPGCLMALSLLPMKEPRRGNLDEISHAPKATRFFDDLRKIVGSKRYLFAVAGYTASTFTVGGFASWVAQYLVSVRHLSLTEADTVFGVMTVATGTLGSIIGGYGAAAFQKKFKGGETAFIVFSTAAAIPFAFMAFLLTNKIGFFTAMALTEFFLFMGQPAVNVIIMESVGPFLRGTATAFSIFMIHILGDFISPPAVGILADHFSLQSGILILPAALFPAVFFYLKCHRLKT